MTDPRPETIERFYELLRPGWRRAVGGHYKAWTPTTYTPRPQTVRQALNRIFREFGQAEQVRMAEWLRRLILENRPEDPI